MTALAILVAFAAVILIVAEKVSDK